MVAPVSPAALIISTTTPDGPAAYMCIKYELNQFNLSIDHTVTTILLKMQCKKVQ